VICSSPEPSSVNPLKQGFASKDVDCFFPWERHLAAIPEQSIFRPPPAEKAAPTRKNRLLLACSLRIPYLTSKSAFCVQTGRRPAALLGSGLKPALEISNPGTAGMTERDSCRNDDICVFKPKRHIADLNR
jgi:hypothetical protein